MYRINYATVLSSRGLRTLPIAFRIAGPHEFDQLVKVIRAVTNLDLADEQVLQSLTDDDINKLDQFEKDNSTFLLGMIFSGDMEDPFHSEKAGSEAYKLQDHDNKMAENTNQFQQNYGAAISMCALLYIFMVTWIPIPPENLRFADTALGMVIGTLIQPVVTNYFGGGGRLPWGNRGNTTTSETFITTSRPPKRQSTRGMKSSQDDSPSEADGN